MSSNFWFTASGAERGNTNQEDFVALEAPMALPLNEKQNTDLLLAEADTATVDYTEGSLVALSGPAGTFADVITGENESVGSTNNDVTADDSTIYIVREGDSIASISALFNITESTLRTANELKKNTVLSSDMRLTIPPTNGVAYIVQRGDTAGSIALRYNMSTDALLEFNYILNPSSLRVGQRIFLPGGDEEHAAELLAREEQRAAARRASSSSSASSRSASYSYSGRFRKPVASHIRMNSGYGPRWGRQHRGLDYAAPQGTPIYASAAGTVGRAGWNSGGFGNMVAISHGNLETLYAHMSRVAVSPGQRVEAGQVIGYMGSTGRSTGSHLHFEIRKNGRAVNPGPYLSN